MKIIHTLPIAYFHLQEQYSDGYLILAHEFLRNPTYKKLATLRLHWRNPITHHDIRQVLEYERL